jgi:hypothetical protein
MSMVGCIGCIGSRHIALSVTSVQTSMSFVLTSWLALGLCRPGRPDRRVSLVAKRKWKCYFSKVRGRADGGDEATKCRTTTSGRRRQSLGRAGAHSGIHCTHYGATAPGVGWVSEESPGLLPFPPRFTLDCKLVSSPEMPCRLLEALVESSRWTSIQWTAWTVRTCRSDICSQVPLEGCCLGNIDFTSHLKPLDR